MSQEQFDAVKCQLMSEENSDLRQSIFSAYLVDAEHGANKIIAFATEKGLKLNTTTEEVIDYLDNLNDEDIDIEMTPEMLTNISGADKHGTKA